MFLFIFLKILIILDIQQLPIQQRFHRDIMVEIDLVEENIDYHPDLIEYFFLVYSFEFFYLNKFRHHHSVVSIRNPQ